MGLPQTRQESTASSVMWRAQWTTFDSGDGALGCSWWACVRNRTFGAVSAGGGGGGVGAAGALAVRTRTLGGSACGTDGGGAAVCAAASCSAMLAFASAVQSALHDGHCTGTGIRPFTGSTSKANFVSHAQRILTSMSQGLGFNRMTFVGGDRLKADLAGLASTEPSQKRKLPPYLL